MGKEIPRRFDHVLVSHHWQVKQARYLEQLLIDGLSDHAPLMVDLESVRQRRHASVAGGIGVSPMVCTGVSPVS